MPSNQHATRAPSHSDTWALCAGSPYEEAKYGDNDSSSPEARLGTAAHMLFEEWFKTSGFGTDRNSKVNPNQYIGYELQVEGEVFLADENMIEALVAAYDYVQGVLAQHPGAQIYSETKVNPGHLWGRDDCWGTADIVIMAADELFVFDYKHGEGIMVEAEGNFQTLLYMIGTMSELMRSGNQEWVDGINKFTTGIMQPRGHHHAGPFRTCNYDRETINAWIGWFGQAIVATDDPNAPLVPGEKQCTWCRGKPGCPALTSKLFDLAPGSGDSLWPMRKVEEQVLLAPEGLDYVTMNQVDDIGDLVITYVKAVKDYKRKLMIQGVDFPGFKLIEGKKGNRKFIKDEKNILNFLSRNFKIKKGEVTTTKLAGPSDILALAKKSQDTTDKKIAALEKLIERPNGKPTVVPMSDERPAINTNAEQIFQDAPQPGPTQEVAQ